MLRAASVKAEDLGPQAAVPIYIAAFIASLSAAMATSATLDSSFFGVYVFAILVLGYVCSFTMRSARTNDVFRVLVCSGVLAITIVATLSSGALRAAAVPPEIGQLEDLIYAVTILYVNIALSFFLLREEVILFGLVPGLAVFGLVGQLNVNLEVQAYFLCFVIATVFLLGYRNLMRRGFIPMGARLIGVWRESLRKVTGDHLLVTSIVFLGLLITANLTARALELATPEPFANRLRERGISGSSRSYVQFGSLFELGVGPVVSSNAEVMVVTAPEEQLWRIKSYDMYDGISWTQTPPFDEEQIRASTRIEDSRVVDEPWDEWEHRLRQDFEAKTTFLGDIPAAATVRTGLFDEFQAYVDRMGGLRLLTPVRPGDTYRVISMVNTQDPELLRKADGPIPFDIWRANISLPLGMSRLRTLTLEIIEGRPTRYDAVMALQTFLEDNFTYNLSAMPYSHRQETATELVFERKEGVCTEFSTALAVMCRLAGIPARVATGYATGEFDPERGGFVVRGKDAHAWTEVYFPNIGWVPFNPAPRNVTPGSPIQRLIVGGGRWWSSVLRFMQRRLIWLIWLLPALWVAAYLGRRHLPKPRLPRWGKPRGHRHRVASAYQHLCSNVGRVVQPRAPGTGLMEYVDEIGTALDLRGPELRDRFAGISERVGRYCFGREMPTAEDVSLLERDMKAFKVVLTNHARAAQHA